jgi:hypothetical protein
MVGVTRTSTQQDPFSLLLGGPTLPQEKLGVTDYGGVPWTNEGRARLYTLETESGLED